MDRSRQHKLLEQLWEDVEGFRSAQLEVENISHTPANIPALDMLLTEAAPRAGRIMQALGTLIDQEATLSPTPDRRLLLKSLADSRDSFAIGLANIRAYLLSGDTQFREKFYAKWKVNSERLAQIENLTYLLTPAQSNTLSQYTTLRKEFAPLPEKMFASRGAEDWNLVNYWLGLKAAPKAAAIKKILQEMRTS